MKWCCPQFAGWYDNAGQRGISILIGRDSSGMPEFLMQYRAVNAGEDLLLSSKAPVLSVTEVGLLYCPWCGRKLDKWYERYIDDLYRPDLKI